MKAYQQPTPNTAKYAHSKPFTDTAEVRVKVEQDIAFLTDRIASMKLHHRPNTVVIETYEAMLNSRIAVLKWLQHGSDDPPAHQSNKSA